MSLSSRIFVVCLSVFQKNLETQKDLKISENMGLGEEGGGRVGDCPPHFHDDVLGAPATLKKGALNYLQEKGCIIGFLHYWQMVLEEQ